MFFMSGNFGWGRISQRCDGIYNRIHDKEKENERGRTTFGERRGVRRCVEKVEDREK